jgi:hypothetical protein
MEIMCAAHTHTRRGVGERATVSRCLRAWRPGARVVFCCCGCRLSGCFFASFGIVHTARSPRVGRRPQDPKSGMTRSESALPNTRGRWTQMGQRSARKGKEKKTRLHSFFKVDDAAPDPSGPKHAALAMAGLDSTERLASTLKHSAVGGHSGRPRAAVLAGRHGRVRLVVEGVGVRSLPEGIERRSHSARARPFTPLRGAPDTNTVL